MLRTDPDNREARDALKRLYTADRGLQRARRAPPPGARAHARRRRRRSAPPCSARSRAIYREHIKSDAALVTVLTQIVAARRERTSTPSASSRASTRRSAAGAICSRTSRSSPSSTDEPDEKAELYRAAARRWLEQFSNVQNAVEAYEELLEVDADDARRARS